MKMTVLLMLGFVLMSAALFAQDPAPQPAQNNRSGNAFDNGLLISTKGKDTFPFERLDNGQQQVHVQFGIINWPDEPRIQFFFNHPKEPVVISYAQWGEPNIGVNWDKEPNPPGKKRAGVTYIAHAYSGNSCFYTFNRSATVGTNFGNVYFTFSGLRLPENIHFEKTKRYRPDIVLNKRFRDTIVIELRSVDSNSIVKPVPYKIEPVDGVRIITKSSALMPGRNMIIYFCTFRKDEPLLKTLRIHLDNSANVVLSKYENNKQDDMIAPFFISGSLAH